MHRGYRLAYSVRLGTALMLLGNVLVWSMGTTGTRWKEFIYLVPANMGLGLTNPSVLFSFISLCEQKGMCSPLSCSASNSPFVSEQAVATSTVYLIRSMGTIYGVTITTAIVQNVLISRLPRTLGPDATEEVRFPI